VAQETSRGCGV